MRILIANDKFKGSLPAEKAGFHIKNSLETAFPAASFDFCPIADGGEGTAQAMTTALARMSIMRPFCLACTPQTAPSSVVSSDIAGVS